MTHKHEIGNRIKILRGQLGYTQEQIANALGVSDGAISSYEQGDSSPSLKNIIKIAHLAHVSIDWLLTGQMMKNQRLPENEEITEEETRLLIAFRRASRPRRRIILQISETLSQRIRKPNAAEKTTCTNK
jgi:transcriptional regulator with XRE-family HTH domain